MSAWMLQVTDLVKHYEVGDEPVHAVDGVSLRISPGEMAALYGPVGFGQVHPARPHRRIPGPRRRYGRGRRSRRHSFSDRDHADYLRLTIGIIGQPEDLMASATARDNAYLKLLRDHPKKAPQLIEPLLVTLGLADRLDQPVRRLSMGERQRVMIAQALANDPKLVLADEPDRQPGHPPKPRSAHAHQGPLPEAQSGGAARHPRPAGRQLRRRPLRTARRAPARV